MKKFFLVTLFTLATLAWAAAQQPTTPGMSSGQATSPGSQTPGAAQTQPSTPGSADQAAGQSGAQTGSVGQPASMQVTEGCLGGTSPNYTVTTSAGTTYKLNIPANADASKLAAHVGESVNVAGNVSSGASSPSIDVRGIGKGTGHCPAGGASAPQSPQQ